MFFRNISLHILTNSSLEIVQIFLLNIAHPKLNITSQESIVNRQSFLAILRDICGRLPEIKQIEILKFLCESVHELRVPEKIISNVQTTSLELMLMGYLVTELGPYASKMKSSLYESLVSFNDHSSRSTIFSLSYTIKQVCVSHPSIMVLFMESLTLKMQQDLTNLNESKPQIQIFLNNGIKLAAIISAIIINPLYVPYEFSAKVFGFALQIIKHSSIQSSSTYLKCSLYRISWLLINSLMSLGQEFVKAHISQLFLIWKQIFIKNPISESVNSRDTSSIYEQVVLRQYALSAMHSFIVNNAKYLISLDVAKRLSIFLSIAGDFISCIPCQFASQLNELKIVDEILLLKKRFFQCCNSLTPKYVFYSNLDKLMKVAIEIIGSDFERNIGKYLITNEKSSSLYTHSHFVTSYMKEFNIMTTPSLQESDQSIGLFFEIDDGYRFFDDLVKSTLYL